MKIEYNDNYSDGAMNRCTSRNCRNIMSIRLDSWVSQAKISLRTFIIILACWVNKFNDVNYITHTHTELHEMMAAPSFHFRSVL